MFKYLSKPTTKETVIQKSRFVTQLFPVSSIDDVDKTIKQLKSDYPKANHYCYAYLLADNNIKKYSDDGEPAKTAGMPILDVLVKNNLDDILAVVIRYFGGIKLGAGGLTRAYRSCVAEAVSISEIVKKVTVPLYELAVDYNIANSVNYLLAQQATLIDVAYKEKVEFRFYCLDDSIVIQINELTGGLMPQINTYLKVPMD